MNPDRFHDIRDAVRALCADFPDEYHRDIDARRHAARVKWVVASVMLLKAGYRCS